MMIDLLDSSGAQTLLTSRVHATVRARTCYARDGAWLITLVLAVTKYG